MKQTARSLFEKSLRSNLGINGVIQLIQKLKKDLPSKDFRMHILSLLEEELAAYQ
ncbi:MAG: hypothetical protein H6765_09430 [Candidatus Peribacteria bacterium]|nr:MAG: hypothetical protein H6765_09430 [Candidatus Peribacteria bacterium]